MTWPAFSLGSVVPSIRNGIFARRPNDEARGSPILRISAVRNGSVNLADSRFVDGVSDEQLEKFSLSPGDILVTRYNGSRHLVGISGLVPEHSGPMLYPDKLIRLVPDRERVDPRFLNYQLQGSAVRTFLDPRIRTTAGQSGIAGVDVRSIPLRIPELSEQRRVVEILEDHLSRLDAADAGLVDAQRRLAVLRERLVRDAITGSSVPGQRQGPDLVEAGTRDGDLPTVPVGWAWRRLGDIADVVGGVTKDASKQSDSDFVEVPYLRVANVQRAALRLENVTTIRVPPCKAKALTLEPGDVLLNEGGDRDKLARGWVWEGQVDDCIHQNHVFRARVRGDLDPFFLSWTANTIGARWAERNGKQSVNLASISLTMIRKMPVIHPPGDLSRTIVKELHDQLASLDRVAEELSSARLQGRLLRRALLAAAFSGKLTGGLAEHELIEVAE